MFIQPIIKVTYACRFQKIRKRNHIIVLFHLGATIAKEEVATLETKENMLKIMPFLIVSKEKVAPPLMWINASYVMIPFIFCQLSFCPPLLVHFLLQGMYVCDRGRG